MSSGEEIVKYVTERIVRYIETPNERRKEERLQRKSSREPWDARWFGMIPMSIAMLCGRFRAKKRAPNRR